MYRSSYEAPEEVPADDAVVLPDALNLPALDEQTVAEQATAVQAAEPAPAAPYGTVPPVPTAVLPTAAPPAALPTAPPVARVRSRRALPLRALLFAGGGLVVAGIVATTIMLASGGRPVSVADAQDSLTVPYTPGQSGEYGGPVTRSTPPPSSAPTPTATVSPVQEPAPVQESPAPAPESKAPAPKPTRSTPPAPPSPSAPVAPAPLAFTGITENRGDNAIGIEIVKSYTLTMTGEPGSTASVEYGWKDAGSVTFDAAGRASLDIGRSVLTLIPGNPRVRAEYSDGTEGDPIEMRRKDIGI
ncbi:hypothetical protein DY023_06395 [Microbacterium bovistercoris]|uniref:Uncharacterized protein n=1 Tax=Microbacterium bovistercoris TaxID=2293570 RepID=A0A371NW68_9MICO|nr:hypothetical protein [Microbacterium bovistercoris]REJ06403.1 hypothetical protein DY023_06395 [Microbacterium bovistercoris]